MNIFVLDTNPILAAQYQCDKHVVKMCLETAQLLCSQFTHAPYKRTHYNHPCSIWTRESKENYIWLYQHGIALCNEYQSRYKKVHKSESVIKWCGDNISSIRFKTKELTTHPLCMPDDCKSQSIIESYRLYYIRYKKEFATWKYTQCPDWWIIN